MGQANLHNYYNNTKPNDQNKWLNITYFKLKLWDNQKPLEDGLRLNWKTKAQAQGMSWDDLMNPKIR